jgi:hypothetical protein
MSDTTTENKVMPRAARCWGDFCLRGVLQLIRLLYSLRFHVASILIFAECTAKAVEGLCDYHRIELFR